MTFVELPVVPIYWHFLRTIKGQQNLQKFHFYILHTLLQCHLHALVLLHNSKIHSAR